MKRWVGFLALLTSCASPADNAPPVPPSAAPPPDSAPVASAPIVPSVTASAAEVPPPAPDPVDGALPTGLVHSSDKLVGCDTGTCDRNEFVPTAFLVAGSPIAVMDQELRNGAGDRFPYDENVEVMG